MDIHFAGKLDHIRTCSIVCNKMLHDIKKLKNNLLNFKELIKLKKKITFVRINGIYFYNTIMIFFNGYYISLYYTFIYNVMYLLFNIVFM